MKPIQSLFAAAAALFLLSGAPAAARDRDNNPPGPAGGPGTNWENPPGPAVALVLHLIAFTAITGHATPSHLIITAITTMPN